MKRLFLVVLTASLVGLSGAIALGHGRHGDRHQRAPEFVDDLAPLGVCGTFVGGDEGTGFQVSTTTYAHQLNSPLGTTAGDAVDFHWVHDEDGSANPAVASPLVWDFGVDEVQRVRMFPSIDHDPVPGEALEATVYSSDSAAGPWVAAHMRRVYAPGWSLGWIADDYVSEWRLRSSARYVAAKWGGPGALNADGDAEIDAMCRADDSGKGHGHERNKKGHEWDKKGWDRR